VARVPVVGRARIAERADEDRVEPAQRVVAVRRDGDAGLEIVVGPPRKVLELELPAKDFADAGEYLHRFRRYLFADSIAWDDRYSHSSIPIAMPMPPDTHNVARPRRAF